MEIIDANIIQKLYERAFHKKTSFINITKLSGGFKNAVYLLEDERNKIVLKMDNQDSSKLITVDRNIMWWEANMLQLMNTCHIPSPEFLFFDDAGDIVPFPYLFMTYLPGYNYFSFKNKMTHQEIESIDYQLGELAYQIGSLKQSDYFLPSQPLLKFNNNYDFVLNLFERLMNDALQLNCFDHKVFENVSMILNNFKASLISGVFPSLSHTDMWEGNILVSGDKVVGLLDFADMYYCDELMNFYFHPIDGGINSSFLKGYHNKQLNCTEQNRIDIYRLYVILKMIVNGHLMGYQDLKWMYQNLDAQISSLSRKRVV